MRAGIMRRSTAKLGRQVADTAQVRHTNWIALQRHVLVESAFLPSAIPRGLARWLFDGLIGCPFQPPAEKVVYGQAGIVGESVRQRSLPPGDAAAGSELFVKASQLAIFFPTAGQVRRRISAEEVLGA